MSGPKRYAGVRLARYHTRRFASGFVLPALSCWLGRRAARRRQPDFAARNYTLADIWNGRSASSNRRDIACVLVNPLAGAFTPTPNAPADSALAASSRGRPFRSRRVHRWLKSLRQVAASATSPDLDEVFVGFRLAAGGAQEYFGVRADL